MLGGLLLIFLILLGYMGFSPLVILPVALIGAAAWVYRPRRGAGRGQAVLPDWSWRSYLTGLPWVAIIAALAYALGWGMRVWIG